MNLTKKPQNDKLNHKLFLVTKNIELNEFNLQSPPENITVLDRKLFDKMESAMLTKQYLKQNKNVYIKGIFENDGTRADFADMYNLMIDGAAGFILETEQARVVQGAIETVQVFENEQI
ncbi:Conserved_hypothetical protein [Hexamita inflata]|uniref:Uncharacterized protein n=1 Tax=Hexamita inflata TaxID=28002 RepID=A0AA86N5Z8_9EUKA|nr:Conserved hypothetical protein [Hexamita inflata]